MTCEDRWYAQGLRFQCTECGDCCTGKGGYIWVSPPEIARLAEGLSLALNLFKSQYTSRIFGRYALKNHPESEVCIFLKNQHYQVYEHRPNQRRSYPWWPRLLSSPQQWEQEARACEGINDEAPLISLETIDEVFKQA